jgi:hypothetical protein
LSALHEVLQGRVVADELAGLHALLAKADKENLSGTATVGIVTADIHDAATAVEHTGRLMEEEPEPTPRIAPERAEPRAHLQPLRLRVIDTFPKS